MPAPPAPATGGIVWIASYPKSGNTWLRVFLSNLLEAGDAAVSINDLPFRLHAASRALFDEMMGIDSSDLDDDEAARMRPLVYRQLAATLAPPVVVKTHDRHESTATGEPLFPREVTRSALYVIRNPLDVAVSYAHHDAVPIDSIIDRLRDESFAVAGAARIHLRQHIGSWSGHVQSWIDSALPVDVARYEDLRREPASTFGALAAAAGIARTAERVQWAIESSSFERLRAQEQRDGFVETPSSGGSFFRSGRAGGWRDGLTHGQVDRIIRDHGPMMTRFGYLSKDGVPQ